MKSNNVATDGHITRKTIIRSALLLALILSVLAFLYVGYIRTNTTEGTYHYLSELADSGAHEVSAKLNGNMQTLLALAALNSHPEIQDGSNVKLMIEALSAQQKYGEFSDLYFASSDGLAYGTFSGNIDISKTEYFKKAMQGDATISAHDSNAINDRQVIVYAVPFRYGNRVVGAICATQDKFNYKRLLGTSLFDEAGFSSIMDSSGTILIFSDQPNSDSDLKNIKDGAHFKHPQDRETLFENLSKNRGDVFEYTYKNTRCMVAYAPIDINDWYILTVLPSYSVRSQDIRTIVSTFLLCIFFILIVISLFLFFSLSLLKSRRQAEHLAYVDELTGGLTLNRFKQLATALLEKSKDKHFACIRLDVQNFKVINDLYGFYEGDQVLKNIYAAIETTLLPTDVFARMQNDDFIILMHYEDAAYLDRQDLLFRRHFSALQEKGGKHYNVSFSEGIYKLTPGETTIVQVLEKATMVHKVSKTTVNNRYVLYDEDIRQLARKEKEIEDTMHASLERGEFVIYLQPKYDLKTEQISGAEALIRWQYAPGDVRLPASFIHIFERNGFIVTIDLFVLEEVCKLQRRWLDEGITPLTISVNQSKLLLDTADYMKTVENIAAKYKVPHKLIELELTETVIHDNTEFLLSTVNQMKTSGFLVSIDDFGNGFSSLNMLKEVPADVLKIDRGFLHRSEDSERGNTVLKNMIRLAKELHMSVVSEGIETEKQAQMLRDLGCDMAQGYLYARPMPVSDFEAKYKRAP